MRAASKMSSNSCRIVAGFGRAYKHFVKLYFVNVNALAFMVYGHVHPGRRSTARRKCVRGDLRAIRERDSPVGVYRRIGFKHGAWHDVAWMQLDLRPGEPEPPEDRR
jgi:hypothetical protein